MSSIIEISIRTYLLLTFAYRVTVTSLVQLAGPLSVNWYDIKS